MLVERPQPPRTLLIIVALMAACAGPRNEAVDPRANAERSRIAETHEGHDSGASAQQGDNAGGHANGAAPNSKSSDDSEHGEHGGHEGHMASVRNMLIEKLGAVYDQPVPEVSDADLAAGKKLYGERCAACHGPTGKGDGALASKVSSAPSDLTDADHARFYSDQGRLWIVRHGIPDTPMKGFLASLGEKGSLQVYAYARSLAQRSAKQAPATHTHDHGGSPHKH